MGRPNRTPPGLHAGVVAFGFGSVFCGLAPGVPELIAARAVVQAAGAGLMVPASLSLLLASVPADLRAKAIGTWSALAAVGAALGPVIGGSLVQFGWRWVFWINLPVAVVAVALSGRVIPESRDERTRGRPDLLGAGLLATSVGLLALALVEAPAWGWGSFRFALVVAVVGAGQRSSSASGCTTPRSSTSGFCGHAPSPASPRLAPLLRRVRGMAAGLVEFLTGVWHFSPVRAGLAIAPGPLIVLPFAWVIAPRLACASADRAGSRRSERGRSTFVAQAYLYASLGAHPSYANELLPAQLLGGAGVGLAIPSLLGAGTASLPPDASAPAAGCSTRLARSAPSSGSPR